MKANRIFLKNHAEVAEAQKLNIKTPPIEVEKLEYYFVLQGVTSAFVTRDGYINMILYGETILLEKQRMVWSRIKKHLSH